MRINFITTNSLKYQIAKSFFDKMGNEYELVQCVIDTPEVQSDSVEDVARQSALWVAKETGEPSVTMDVGFCIEALNGFPGPFVKYINNWLDQDDIIQLLARKDNRKAYFIDALAIAYPDGSTQVFSTKTQGSIANVSDPINTKWTMNSLFIPDGYSQTLGSMSDDEQTKFWDDKSTWAQLIDYLATDSGQI